MDDMISYVIYDPDTGELLSSHLQVPSPEHTYRVPATDEQRLMWPLYMLNEDRTALVKNPTYFPDEFPPAEPEPQEPQEPPVDPEPEDPVQSDEQFPQP